jgi:GcrA cell cycle regulator
MRSKLSKNKILIDLEAGDCRWPVGDPRHADFHFCGAQKIAGRPYCAAHWEASFVPGRPRYQTTQTSAPALLVRSAA